MKELVGIILLTVLVVFGSCNSNTNVSLVGTSPQLFDVCQVKGTERSVYKALSPKIG